MPPYIKEAIQNTTIFLNDYVTDEFIWGGNLEGVYTAKSGYQWLNSKRARDSSKPWSRLWKFHAPEKVRFFLYVAGVAWLCPYVAGPAQETYCTVSNLLKVWSRGRNASSFS